MNFPDMITLAVPPLDLIIRTIVVYAVILLLLRIAGRRQIGQLGPTELVAMLLISNAVQNSMNGGDNSLVGGLIAAATLVIVSRLVSYVTFRSAFMSALIEGKEITVVIDGKVQLSELNKVLMTPAQLRAQLMFQGVEDVTNLHKVVMNGEGRLLVTHKAQAEQVSLSN